MKLNWFSNEIEIEINLKFSFKLILKFTKTAWPSWATIDWFFPVANLWYVWKNNFVLLKLLKPYDFVIMKDRRRILNSKTLSHTDFDPLEQKDLNRKEVDGN